MESDTTSKAGATETKEESKDKEETKEDASAKSKSPAKGLKNQFHPPKADNGDSSSDEGVEDKEAIMVKEKSKIE